MNDLAFFILMYTFWGVPVLAMSIIYIKNNWNKK